VKRAKAKKRKAPERRWGGGDVFVALSDPTRRRIMDLLSDGDQPVHELAQDFGVSRPAISQHLRVLREVGLVQERRVGRERHYRLQAGALREVAAWIARYERFWDERLTDLGAQLDAMAHDEKTKNTRNK
jgi:DNA-binding transcriptional ArsR family regulator